MSGVRMLHFLKDWWKFIKIHQYYTMALKLWTSHLLLIPNFFSNLPCQFKKHCFDVYWCVLWSISSVESQKGMHAAQQCPIEFQKGTASLYIVYGISTLLVLNGTLLNSTNAILALSWWYCFYSTNYNYSVLPDIINIFFTTSPFSLGGGRGATT